MAHQEPEDSILSPTMSERQAEIEFAIDQHMARPPSAPAPYTEEDYAIADENPEIAKPAFRDKIGNRIFSLALDKVLKEKNARLSGGAQSATLRGLLPLAEDKRNVSWMKIPLERIPGKSVPARDMGGGMEETASNACLTTQEMDVRSGKPAPFQATREKGGLPERYNNTLAIRIGMAASASSPSLRYSNGDSYSAQSTLLVLGKTLRKMGFQPIAEEGVKTRDGKPAAIVHGKSKPVSGSDKMSVEHYRMTVRHPDPGMMEWLERSLSGKTAGKESPAHEQKWSGPEGKIRRREREKSENSPSR